MNGLAALLARKAHDQLCSSATFNRCTTCVLPGWVCTATEDAKGEETQNIMFVMSSGELLCNAYRQQCSGWKTTVCVDMTHRLISEGHSVFVVGTRDMPQHFEKIAHGVTSCKDANAHVAIMNMTKLGVEACVNRIGPGNIPL